MKNIVNVRREPLIILVSIGLGLGLLLTGLSWVSPAFAKGLFSGTTWFWSITLVGTLLMLTGAKLAQEQRYPTVPKPVLLLAVVAATALVYLFPELFAPGCGNMPRAFAACPAACRITSCSDWAAPGERGCNAKPPDKGCCFAYETTCDPDCSDPGEPDPTPTPVYAPPTVTGWVTCVTPGINSWCRAGAVLHLSASDPQGFPITTTWSLNGDTDSCATSGCTMALPPGSGTISFKTRTPSTGLSSSQGSLTYALDPNPPVVNLVVSGPKASNGWYTSASVSASAYSDYSGMASSKVSVDGGGWQTSVILTEGIHSIIGRGDDKAGNSTVTAAQVVKVDATAPIISASITSGTLVAGWYVTDITLTSVASDATSGLALIEHRLDGGNWTTGETLTVSTEGPHTVDFRATDQAGLVSSTSLSFKVDKTPPLITFTPSGITGANGWYTSPVTLQINAADPLSGVASIENRLDAGSWVPGNILILNEGEHTVEARATDKAGNLSTVSAAETIGIKIDTTAPTLSLALNGTLGKNDWYVSNVTVTANVSDSTSGIALTEHRLDGGGSWQSGTSLTVSTDGPHSVDFRTTDQAGNQTSDSRSFKIDQTKPLSVFVSPREGSSGTVASGSFGLNGQSSDATSGLAFVQISTDGGDTWIDLDATPTGGWHYTWETRGHPNNLYPVLARTEDLAGNLKNSAHVTLLLANQPPKVSIQESWWVWESGELAVGQRFIPITEIRVRIACLDGQPDVKLTFTPESLPSELQWDRKCGQGQFATSGDHSVTLTACDQFGNCASAEGVIKVPFIALPIPTWTPTASPSATQTAAATALRFASPTPTQIAVTPAPLPPAPPPAAPFPWLNWGITGGGLLGLYLTFALNALIDPRPKALRRLRATWRKLSGERE